MIGKVLIANRGEIAVRIIRACREMGIETVAVYSEADREALHTQLADEAICIGPAPSSESYLNMQNIISATLVSGADAIHPGFGFLSENSRFAELCEQCNITFIGPDSEVIRKLGNKSEARNTMMNAGVPVIPGSKDPIYDAEEGARIAAGIGYPVIVKAALGGGGKGMRVAETPDEFENSFKTAQKEAQMAFGDNTTDRRKELYRQKRRGQEVDGDIQTITRALRPLRSQLRTCVQVERAIPQIRAQEQRCRDAMRKEKDHRTETIDKADKARPRKFSLPDR